MSDKYYCEEAMIIEGLTTRRVETSPNQDPTLGAGVRQTQDKRDGQSTGGASSVASASAGSGPASFGDQLSLSPEAQQQVSKLQQRDREVRSHEQAHISAAGPHAQGGATFTYAKGPDNKQYATGGSVHIDTSPVPDDPDATKEKARMVRSAALAPGSPSAQDQSVAAQAASMEMQARTEDAQDTAGIPVTPAAEGAATAQSTPHNTGGLFGIMEFQARGNRAAAAYQAQQDRFIPPSDLAPWGTGIEITV